MDNNLERLSWRSKVSVQMVTQLQSKINQGLEPNSSPSEWETPPFAQIKKKKTKRLSPYWENEIWELDELQTIIKYEPHKRNKAALALMWDLSGRNHEITLLKLRHIRLRDKYGEGEIPHESKTGSGPILLTCSFPYVRDWLNEHPFRNQPDSRLICNLMTGAPVKPEALWTMMKRLKSKDNPSSCKWRHYRCQRTTEIRSPAHDKKVESILHSSFGNYF